MKKTVLIISLIAIAQFVQAQSFQWANNMGGGQETRGKAVKTDLQGNVYTAGTFRGTADFDPGAGIYTLTSAGDYDAFVTKLDAAGNFIWAKTWGGTGDDQLYALSVDASGNVFSTGYFYGTVDFDPAATSYTATSAGNKDIYLSKLNTAGNFMWAKTMGEPGFDQALSLANDLAGNIFIAGIFQGTIDFDPGASTHNLISTGYADGFIAKLDAAGNLAWAKNMGGTALTDYVSCNAIELDAGGNLCVTGAFQGTADFDPNAGTYTLTSSGNYDMFVTRIDASGNFMWAKGIGSTGADQGTSIASDASGNIYVSGIYQGTPDFDASATTYTMTSAGSYDSFIIKTDASGNLIWAKSIGGASSDAIATIELNSTGDIFATGTFAGTSDCDPGAGTYTITSHGIDDGFLLQLDGNGNFLSAVAIGGATNDNGQGLAIDIADHILLTGLFTNTVDFDPGAGVYTMAGTAGNFHCYVLKLAPSLPTDIKKTSGSELASAKLYPNPSKGIFTISSVSVMTAITIYNLQGAIIYDQPLNVSMLAIDLTDIEKGVYFYQIRDGKGNTDSGKMILE